MAPINPDDFEGTDREKVDAAIRFAAENNDRVFFSRQYTLGVREDFDHSLTKLVTYEEYQPHPSASDLYRALRGTEQYVAVVGRDRHGRVNEDELHSVVIDGTFDLFEIASVLTPDIPRDDSDLDAVETLITAYKDAAEQPDWSEIVYQKRLAALVPEMLEEMRSLRERLRREGDPTRNEITVRRPHVPHGPKNVPVNVADADYLREAADTLVYLREHSDLRAPWGSNVTETIRRLLVDCADVLDPRKDLS